LLEPRNQKKDAWPPFPFDSKVRLKIAKSLTAMGFGARKNTPDPKKGSRSGNKNELKLAFVFFQF